MVVVLFAYRYFSLFHQSLFYSLPKTIQWQIIGSTIVEVAVNMNAVSTEGVWTNTDEVIDQSSITCSSYRTTNILLRVLWVLAYRAMCEDREFK